ncbi:HNH endonuclease [Congregibacter variabilis]|uniref:HNH endonuclease n=1 Tax=Congregibacter variabilis TaxID=3081200 RepID=A0ABZ0I9V9_9GAMM|nr:HNH endonuclease [Congregibacter sp. IMCC43200]
MQSQFRSKEQANFSRIVSQHMLELDAPLLLEGGTGLGKTRAYLRPLIDSGRRVAIVLPTHQLIQQLLESKDLHATQGQASVVAFKPARFFDDRNEYLEHRAVAKDAQVLLCTSASVIIDQRLGGEYNGVIERDYILFDEADQLPGVAALQSDREIAANDIGLLGIKQTTAQGVAEAILSKRAIVAPEIRAAAKMILEAIEEPAWYHAAGMTDDGAAALFHRLPGRLLKKIANRGNVAFVSATLSIAGKFNDFKSALGIGLESRLSASIEPERHGTLRFSFDGEHAVGSDEWIDTVKATLLDVERPCLVITPSHTLSLELAIDGATVRTAEETTADAVSRMDDDLLIAAGAWAGLDTPVHWRAIVIPRVPYAAPTVLDEHVESSYINMRNEAVRRMRQGIGRGLRKPDAVCHVYVMDPRASKLSGFVPRRFLDDWKIKLTEGGRRTVELSQIERSSYYRKLALRHYGKQCQACDFVPTADRQLHVHHLFPLAEGERQTTLQDLAVLCANCHELAHSESPPLSLEELRILANDG